MSIIFEGLLYEAVLFLFQSLIELGCKRLAFKILDDWRFKCTRRSSQSL